MTTVTLVYAQSRNGVIGDEGGLPWHIPSDLKRFKESTLGKPVIMGRKTWESLPRKPLPGRLNIVMTRQPGYVADGAHVALDVDAALRLCGNVPEICVIGGGEIYHQFLPRAGQIFLTEVDVEVAGDTLAPVLDPKLWREVARHKGVRTERDSASFVTRVMERVT